ncbi:hypothetical protein AN219_11750 [Streptomyces nanshensis]|nr:hypothetical protein AN219_11750 [Streptomyces nanshensis]
MEPTRLRLLPWPSPNGGPSYTPDDLPAGVIARMADEMEDCQERSARFVLKLSREMLELSEERELTMDEAKYVINRLCESLGDVLRVAESRGDRLPALEELDEPPEPEDLDGAGD